MDVWVCVCYQKRRLLNKVVDKIASKLYVTDRIFNSKEKADIWLEKALHQGGPDPRFWIPKVIKRKVE